MPAWTIADTRAFLATDLTPDEWRLGDAIPEVPSDGPDTLALTYEGVWSLGRGESPPITAFEQGDVPLSYAGPGTWRVVSAKPVRQSGPFWRAEVVAKGQFDDKAPKIRWITGSSAFTAENIAVPDNGIVPTVGGRQPVVGMEISYVTIAATPTPDSPGIAATPPAPRPPDPTNWWSFISAEIAVQNFPNGWVRDAVDNDRLAPGLWWTTERYSYIFAVTGGGG